MSQSSDTCIHRQQGLCPSCQIEQDIDPAGWEQFGNHPEGIARWKAEEAMQYEWEQEQLAQQTKGSAQQTEGLLDVGEDDIPF